MIHWGRNQVAVQPSIKIRYLYFIWSCIEICPLLRLSPIQSYLFWLW